MKTNHDGTVTSNAYDTWTSCSACGQKVTEDLIHTCSPQTKPLSDEEMKELINNFPIIFSPQDLLTFARAVEERHGIK